ncbi:MAG: RNA polymerase subunit sigma [Marivirga sp.]|nr:RNA polymerase subunit sigma [Marivirga sp.]
MQEQELLRNLFNVEHQRIISELRYLFAIEIEIAEDLVSDTFLSATEFWKKHGLPENPTAWLHTVAKNKARNHLKKKAIFDQKLSPELKLTPSTEEIEFDFSKRPIDDSQLAMIFTICNPCLSNKAQVGLALNLLCGFGIQEIADAFFTTKHVIYKRLERAKERLKINNIKIEQPPLSEIHNRLDNVLTILYLLFSEGHFSISQDRTLRESFCTEAMRLNYFLIENPVTNTPAVNALFALMCFHSSRFAARIKGDGTIIPYDEQNEALWDKELIAKGRYHLNIAARGKTVTKFHLEAGIAYWHTRKEDTQQKWESILRLYNKLLDLEYSPVAALNRTYALAKVKGKTQAIKEAESLQLRGNLFYHALLSFLYHGFDDKKALQYSLPR